MDASGLMDPFVRVTFRDYASATMVNGLYFHSFQYRIPSRANIVEGGIDDAELGRGFEHMKISFKADGNHNGESKDDGGRGVGGVSITYSE